MSAITNSNQPPVPPIEMKDVNIAAIHDPDYIIFKDINWSVARGEFWVVGAPHSSGKSDFLMTTAGLMPPAAGRYEFFGNETRIFDESRLADRLRVGFVFENADLFHYLNVGENVALPLRYHNNLDAGAGAKAIAELLAITELKALADVMPADLPRSWLKRAALARALALQPDILMADNPLGALDARHSHWWLRFLHALTREHQWLGGKTLTIITTTDDFRPWHGGNRRFALLKDNSFVVLGSWADVISSNDPLVKELLVTPVEEAERAKD